MAAARYLPLPRPPTLQARAKGLPLRVTCITPGPIDTPFVLGKSFGDGEDAAAVAEGGVQLQVGDIVRAVVWCMTAPEHVEVNDVVVRAIPTGSPTA